MGVYDRGNGHEIIPNLVMGIENMRIIGASCCLQRLSLSSGKRGWGIRDFITAYEIPYCRFLAAYTFDPSHDPKHDCAYACTLVVPWLSLAWPLIAPWLPLDGLVIIGFSLGCPLVVRLLVVPWLSLGCPLAVSWSKRST